MNQDMKEVVVTRDEAVFWMDENSHWHNQHGAFQHPKVMYYMGTLVKRYTVAAPHYIVVLNGGK